MNALDGPAGRRHGDRVDAYGLMTLTVFLHAPQGIGVSMLCMLPTVGLSFAVYEGLQNEWRRRARIPRDEHLGHFPNLCCAAVGTFVACTAAWPLNNVRKRMQMQARTALSQSRTLFTSPGFAVRAWIVVWGCLLVKGGGGGAF